jgi:hypothetical protein
LVALPLVPGGACGFECGRSVVAGFRRSSTGPPIWCLLSPHPRDPAPAHDAAPTPDEAAPAFDASTAHPARRYDYFLGGKDNFAADRASGDAIAERFPAIRTTARQNRAFLHRAVTYLPRDAGISQYLDIGTGLPTADNTHQIAQHHQPKARVVYVYNDPLVLAHARALLTSPDPGAGAIAYLDADLRHPHTILTHPALTTTLDLNRPVALLLVAVLHFLPDTDHPFEVVRALVDALAPAAAWSSPTPPTTCCPWAPPSGCATATFRAWVTSPPAPTPRFAGRTGGKRRWASTRPSGAGAVSATAHRRCRARRPVAMSRR